MKYEENNSEWIKKQIKNKILSKNNNETRIKSIKRLIESKLPTYDYFFLKYDEFMQEEKIKEIYNQYKSVVIRACPTDESKYNRYTEISKSYIEVKKILEQKISK